jgi:hypothetical protein
MINLQNKINIKKIKTNLNITWKSEKINEEKIIYVKNKNKKIDSL